MWVLVFSKTFVWNIFHPNRNWSRYGIKMCIGLHVKCPLVFSDFLMKLEFSRQIFEKIPKYQISWKSVPWVPSCSIRTDDEAKSSLFAILRTRLTRVAWQSVSCNWVRWYKELMRNMKPGLRYKSSHSQGYFSYHKRASTESRRYQCMRESHMKNFKSAIKIRNTVRLSCKLTTVILMVWRVADRWQYDTGMQYDGAVVV